MTIDSALGSKRPYKTPKLVVYGDISSLTKNNTGSQVEGAGGGNNQKRP